MAFAANPLALSVPEPAFESWLRDSGYLEILDQRTTAAAAANSDVVPAVTAGFFASLFSHIFTFLSLFTLNPFAKLTAEDFAGDTPSWSHAFIGCCGSYSFPSSPSQARLRVQENVKRYARNYAYLFILFFACTLTMSFWSFCNLPLLIVFAVAVAIDDYRYKMPVPLFGLISCLALWEFFKFCSDRWGLAGYPVTRMCLIRLVQCATAIVLIFFNVQLALFCALSVSYAGMILHAAFRKLTPAAATKHPSRRRVWW